MKLRTSALFISFVALLLSPFMVSAHVETSESIDPDSSVEPCVVGSVIQCGGHGNNAGSDTLEEVVNDLFVGFNVSSVDQLDCDAIVEHDFEHVGEALMSYMHPDEEEHERIDNLIGGEGSQALHDMHVFMGKRYLGCATNSYGPMMMSFVNGAGYHSGGFGTGMMAMMGMPFQMMSGQFTPLAFTSLMSSAYLWMGVVQMLIWVLAILGVLWLIQTLTKKK